MWHFGPLHLIDAAHAPRCFEHGPKAIGTDEHGRDAAPFELHLVEQTARAATASITVSEQRGIAVVDARPFVAAHHAGGVVAPPHDAGDVVSRPQYRFDMIHQLDGVELHVRPQPDAFAIEGCETGCQRTGDDQWRGYRID